MALKSKIDIKKVVSDSSEYIMNTYGRADIVFVDGDGAKVIDSKGKEYIDLVAGLAVNILGHKNKKLVAALRKASNGIWHTSNLYHIADQVNVAKIINKIGLKGKTFFCNSGAEANEAALKLAFKHASKISEEKTEIVALTNSFHGRTLGSLSTTWNPKYRSCFPSPTKVTFVDLNDVAGLEAAINKNTAALMVEVVQGESGVNIMREEFYKACRKITRKHKAVFIVDEVQTGLYRTGEPFAFRHYSKSGAPDVITMAKALAGGMAMGAMHASKAFSDVFVPGDHASTFGGNPLVTSVSFALLKHITRKAFITETQAKSAFLKKELKKLKAAKEIRGMGFMFAIDIDKNATKVAKACLKDGVIVNAIGDNTLRLVPPLVITEEQIKKAIEVISKHIS